MIAPPIPPAEVPALFERIRARPEQCTHYRPVFDDPTLTCRTCIAGALVIDKMRPDEPGSVLNPMSQASHLWRAAGQYTAHLGRTQAYWYGAMHGWDDSYPSPFDFHHADLRPYHPDFLAGLAFGRESYLACESAGKAVAR